MRVTIIPSDSFVSVNGEGLNGVSMAGIDPDIHAIQFSGSAGRVEWIDGRQTEITNLTPYAFIIDNFLSLKAELLAKRNDPYYGLSGQDLIERILKNKAATLQAEFAARMQQPLLFEGELFAVDEWSIRTIETTMLTCIARGYGGIDPVPVPPPLQPGYWFALDESGKPRKPVPMTYGRLQQLVDALYTRNALLWGKLVIHEATLEAMVAEGATATQLRNYNVQANWT